MGGRALTTDDGLSCSTSTYDYQDRTTTTTSGLNTGTCTDGGDGSTTTNTYDGLGRLTLAQITAGVNVGDKTTNDVYDSAGDKLSDSTTKSGVVATATTQFNLLGQAMSVLAIDGSTTKSDYDPAGNVSDSCLWASGSTVGSCYPVGTTPWTNPPTKATSSVYDAGNHTIASTDAATAMTTTYDPTHDYAVAATYLPTGSGHEYQTYYTYDSKQRVTALTHQDCTLSTGHSCTSANVVGSDAYTYDANDNRTQVTEYNGATTTNDYYCYDANNRLVAEKSGSSCATNPDETYTYDDSGNRLTATVGGVTTNFAYDSDGRLCAVGATSCSSPNVTYDDAGRTATYNGWSYLYDSAGRLVSACQSTSCTGSGFNRVDYTYDGDGNRTQIVDTTAGGVATTTTFTYQGGIMVGESVNGTPSRGYLAAGGSMAEMTIPSGSEAGTYIVTWNGHDDATSLNLINGDGSLTPVNSYSYSTWGTPTTSVASGASDLAFRFLYIGSGDVQWDNDFSISLEYMHARSYSPALGRFLQPDPSGEDLGYAYSQNDPVGHADPTGTFAIPRLIWGVEWGYEGQDYGLANLAVGLVCGLTSFSGFFTSWIGYSVGAGCTIGGYILGSTPIGGFLESLAGKKAKGSTGWDVMVETPHVFLRVLSYCPPGSRICSISQVRIWIKMRQSYRDWWCRYYFTYSTWQLNNPDWFSGYNGATPMCPKMNNNQASILVSAVGLIPILFDML